VDEVVKVAAHSAGRAVQGGQGPTWQLRHLSRQEVLLDQASDLELVLDALTGADLQFLLAHQLPDPHRRSRLGGQILEQLAVVGGIILLRQTRSEVE